jgi:predicted membrane-bound spermidine synthase
MARIRAYVPHGVVFITSMGVMIVELVASRIVSKYFGNSLYTWTGVIGVVLGGISLGNYIGGKIADRFDPEKSIGVLLLVSSALVFLILALDQVVAGILGGGSGSIVTARMVVRSVVWILLLFFLPATALGTISPVMAKYALQKSDRIGNTVGSIYAVSAIGSIVGTFLAGFVLIPSMGVSTIIFLVGGVVALLALLLGGYRVVSAAWLVLILLGYLLIPGVGFAAEFPLQDGDALVLYETDSQYSHIKVQEVPDGDGGVERQLVMDGLIHNRYEPGNPDRLLYDYEKIFAALAEEKARELGDEPMTTLTLGGGAVLFPHWTERRYPSSVNDVVEIDPEVILIARQFFEIPEDADLTIYNTDARNFVQYIRGKRSYDIVFIDAFNSFSIPSHLTTREHLEAVDRILEPNGLVVANTIDVFSIGKFLNAYLNTVETVYGSAAVYVDADADLEQRLTFVIIGGGNVPEAEYLYGPYGGQVARRISDELLQDLRERNGETVLTDDYAPVENLMAPVFLNTLE